MHWYVGKFSRTPQVRSSLGLKFIMVDESPGIDCLRTGEGFKTSLAGARFWLAASSGSASCYPHRLHACCWWLNSLCDEGGRGPTQTWPRRTSPCLRHITLQAEAGVTRVSLARSRTSAVRAWRSRTPQTAALRAPVREPGLRLREAPSFPPTGARPRLPHPGPSLGDRLRSLFSHKTGMSWPHTRAPRRKPQPGRQTRGLPASAIPQRRVLRRTPSRKARSRGTLARSGSTPV